MTEEVISSESAASWLKKIQEKNWWQGSVIPTAELDLAKQSSNEFWVITSQACNLYNSCFDKVPVIELISATKIDKCDHQKTKGDNPRILHVEAKTDEGLIVFLEIDIQKRQWLHRSILANIPAPSIHIRDAIRGSSDDWYKNLWLDNFAGWLARSYTRIALPDAFNDAMRASRIEDILKNKLAKHKEELYGIYLLVDADTEDGWNGNLGEMPPPYNLEIMLVTYENIDPKSLKNELVRQLFDNEIQYPEDKTKKGTRAQLAKKHGIRIAKSSIEARTIAEVTLLELKSLVRYTFIDHLSDSSMATSN